MKAEQLRKSILQLAIQGKLVPQDPNDEPASVLLERIRAEKQRLIKQGKIKKDKGDSVIFKGDDNCYYEKFADGTVKCIEDELPFEIPESWCWCRLKQAGELKSGYAFKSNEYVENGIQVVRISDLDNDTILTKNAVYYPRKAELESYLIQHDSILICLTGSIGKIAWVNDNLPRYLNQRVGMFVHNKLCNTPYLWTFFQTNYVLNQWIAAKTSTNGNIKNSDVNNLLFPVPPLVEQARIVAEIEKYKPLLAEYDKLEQQATKLDDEIYNNLKKSILQYAIQGKLVPQAPNDEPASVLLERIRAEKKAQLGKKYVESYIYKGDDNCYYEKVGKNDPVKLEDLPFDIPDTWAWARLKYIVYNNGQKIPTSDFSYIDIGSIDNKRQKLSVLENIISADKAPSRARKIVKLGDILYSTVRPYLHNMCIIDKIFSYEPIASTGFAVLSCEKGIYNQFLFYYMLSPIFDLYANSTENAKGVAYPAINDDRLYKALIPIPPQAEQERICLKIKEMLQCIEKDES